MKNEVIVRLDSNNTVSLNVELSKITEIRVIFDGTTEEYNNAIKEGNIIDIPCIDCKDGCVIQHL